MNNDKNDFFLHSNEVNHIAKGKRIRDATLSIIIHSFTFAP